MPHINKLAKNIFMFLILKTIAKILRKSFLKNVIIKSIKITAIKMQKATKIQTLPRKMFAVAKIATTANKNNHKSGL